MEKIFKYLHKQLDCKMSKCKEINEIKEKIAIVFKEEKLELKEENDFDFYNNEITYYGILNKRKIEDAYFQGLVKMNDYFSVLDYNEKKRLMNYEIELCCENLVSFKYDDDSIFIPFFDIKMNRIYQFEIVIFELKQYYKLINDYKDIMDTSVYGTTVYQSKFSSLEVVGEYKDIVSLYCPLLKRIYFIKDGNFIEFITLKNTDDIILESISLAYFYDDMNQLVKVLEDTNNVNEKQIKKLNKYLKRK